MDEDKTTVKKTVKAVIPLHDSGLWKLMREYRLYKKVLIPRVQQAVRQVIKDKNVDVYAQQKWMVDKKLEKYLKNLPFHPMPFHRQSVYIERKDGGFWMHFKTKQGEAVCHLHVPDKYVPFIEKACGKDNPVLGQVELIEDKSREWVNCHIALRLSKPESYEPKGWLGVDVGWNKLATSILAICNPHLAFSHPTFHGKEFKTRIIQLRHLLKEAQRKGRAIKMWRNRLKNTTNYAVDFVAKEIVSKAKRLKAGVAMEKLTFKSVTKGYLIPRYKLMIAIRTVCEREGIPFKLVPAQYTSLLCPRCGSEESRKLAEKQGRDKKEKQKIFLERIRRNRHGARFKCVDCDYQADADIVGAMNIALRADTQMEGVMRRGLSSTLKPRKASPSEAGCVAQPKAPMRDVPLKRGVSHAEQSREKEEAKAKPQGGVEKRLEEWLKIEKEA